MTNEVLKLTIVTPPKGDPVRSLGVFDLMDSSMHDTILKFLENANELLPDKLDDPEALKDIKSQEARTINEGKLIAAQFDHHSRIVSLHYMMPDATDQSSSTTQSSTSK